MWGGRFATSGGVWVWAAVWACVGVAQRPPCYNCHPYPHPQPLTPTHRTQPTPPTYITALNSSKHRTVGRTCKYPCECEDVPECSAGVPLIHDGCGCCMICAGQVGEACHHIAPCDTAKNLTCIYDTTPGHTGTCKDVRESVGCEVDGRHYQHGQSFTPDCRTQCTCQNGTYACVSLCPAESLLPSSPCHNPHLVPIRGRCCREWMCDANTDKMTQPKACKERNSGKWSPCSVQTCGAGVSNRWATDEHCQLVNQTRLCQLRPCQQQFQKQPQQNSIGYHERHGAKHHVRRSHQCKATLRSPIAVRLRAGWCVSVQRYRPKSCADCKRRCCYVHASTTVTLAFLCPLHANTNLLALPHTKRLRTRRPPPTTPTPSVYDMMDEGQPVWEAVLSNPQNDDPHTIPEDDQEEVLEHEDLTLDDDTLYNDIRSDNYETVHYQVEWILRCKCTPACQAQTRAPSSLDVTSANTT